MAEMVTAIENIEASKFLKLCDKYDYHIPETLLRELNSKENRYKNISVIYADEFNPQWQFNNNHLIVKRHFCLEMLNEIKGVRKNAKYLNEEIEIIIRLIEAFNKGGRSDACNIVDYAIMQYDRLKEKVINAEEKIKMKYYKIMVKTPNGYNDVEYKRENEFPNYNKLIEHANDFCFNHAEEVFEYANDWDYEDFMDYCSWEIKEISVEEYYRVMKY